MDAAAFPRALAGRILVAVVGATLLGCQSTRWPFMPPESASQEAEVPPAEPAQRAQEIADSPNRDSAEQPADAAQVPGLADDRWVMHVLPASATIQPDVRWHHLTLDSSLAASPSRRPDLSPSLANPNPVVAANAAIVIGRWSDGDPVAELTTAIRNESLKLPLRLASIETLGMMASEGAKRAIAEILAETDREATGSQPLTAIPEIHAELLCAHSRHVDVVADAQFTTALRSPSALIRREAAMAWARHPTPALESTPIELLDLCGDSDTRVRAAAIQAAAVHRHSRAVEYLSRGTRDFDITVRIAAIRALGEIGSEQARLTLDKLRKDPSEIARAATIGALAALGADEAVIAAATDRSARVRQAVAESLKELKSDAKLIEQDSNALARQLVQDTSSEVQRRAIESLREWPLEQAGPPLLLAMEQGTYLARKLAAAQLAQRWPAAAGFYHDATADRRVEQLAELRKAWEREFGTVEQQVVQAAATEVVRAMGITEEQIAVIERLSSSDPRDCRAAIAELVQKLDGQPLSDAALDRLAQTVQGITDPLVWQAVLDLLSNDPRQVALQLAYVAVANASSEVRRRACEYLQSHADKQHLEVLTPMLEDPNGTVVIAAVRAIGAAGVGDPQPLLRLLNAPDRQLRLEAAMVLARSKVEAGFAAIERLGRETDLEIRRAATVAMGEIGDPVFLPALMQLIEDRRDIQLAAMTSLARIAGHDVAEDQESPLLPDEKVRRWKQWYGQRSEARIQGSD